MPLEQKYLDLIRVAVPGVDEEKVLNRLSGLFDLVVETNQRINITSLVSPIDVTLKHLIDSLTLLSVPEVKALMDRGVNCCDIGCGGGFPGLPIACAYPEISLTMIDSTAKKIAALKENAEKLGLHSVCGISGRGEELASAKSGVYREKFQLCFSRAVARLPVLCELCLPFVEVGGLFAAMKGLQAEEEVKESLRAIPMLGGKLVDVRELKIDLDYDSSSDFSAEELEKIRDFSSASRYIVLIEKRKKSLDIYPRTWAQMTKKVL